VVGSLAGSDGGSPLSSLPLVGGLTQGGSPLSSLSNVASLTGNGGPPRSAACRWSAA